MRISSSVIAPWGTRCDEPRAVSSLLGADAMAFTGPYRVPASFPPCGRTCDQEGAIGRGRSQRPPLWRMVFVLGVLLLTPRSVPAMITVGSIDFGTDFGFVIDVEIDGTIAYVADRDYGLRVIDVSDPTAPRQLTSVPFLPARALDIAVQGSNVYVAAGRVRVFDSSDPSNLRELEGFDSPSGGAVSIAVRGNLAYLGEDLIFEDPPHIYLGAVRIVDFSDPEQPRSLGLYRTLDDVVTGVAVEGGVAYVAAGVDGFWSVDVSDPANPRELDGVPPSTRWRAVTIVGDRAYASTSSGVVILDVSNPSALRHISTFGTGAFDVDVVDSLAYVARQGLRVFDLSDESEPIRLGELDMPGVTFSVAIGSGIAYVGDADDRGPGGLRLVDVSKPIYPKLKPDPTVIDFGFVRCHRVNAQSVVWNDATLYVAGTRFRVLGLEPKEGLVELIELASLDLPGVAEHVEVRGSLAYVATLGEVAVFDISNGGAPARVAAYDVLFAAMDIDIDGSIAVVVGGEGLHVVDVSDSSSPARLALLDIAATSVELALPFAYVGSIEGLLVLDLSTPQRPEVRARLTDLPVANLEVAGRFAYVSAPRAGPPSETVRDQIHIVDVSDPLKPSRRGRLDLGIERSPRGKMTLAGSRLFVTNGQSLRVIDISNADAPREIGAVVSPNREIVADVAVQGSIAYSQEIGSACFWDFGPEFVPEPRSSVLKLSAILTVVGLRRRYKSP